MERKQKLIKQLETAINMKKEFVQYQLSPAYVRLVERKLHSHDLLMEQIQVSKDNDMLTVIWQVSGKKEYLLKLTNILANAPGVISFKRRPPREKLGIPEEQYPYCIG